MAMEQATEDTLVRVGLATAGGAVGGAALGGILSASGATSKTGAAYGYGALLGAASGLVASGIVELVAWAQRPG